MTEKDCAKLESCHDTMSSQPRHAVQCSVCHHKDRFEIEQVFLNWSSPSKIAKSYGITRDALYRHARALGLMTKRSGNVRFALEKIIEKADAVEPNASAVVSAVAMYAKINARGQGVERIEQVNLNELFDRMTHEKLERYAADGTLPAWFEHATGSMRRSCATLPEDSGYAND